MKVNQIKQISLEIFQIALGILLASIGLKAFLLPNGFLDGGVTGIALLLSALLGFNISLSLLVVSIPFLILGWFRLSKKIVLKSIISIIALASAIHLEYFDPITNDKLLVAIFGGICLGSGIGLAIKNGAVLDGSEILGIFLNEKLGISIGNIILVFNIILFSITAILISVEIAMYSILTFLVTAKFIDIMIEGFDDFVGLMIISKKSVEIEHELILNIGVGMTIYKGAKGFGKSGNDKEKDIIHTVINRIDMRRTYNLIEEIDEKAFIIEFHVNSIKGGILKKYFAK
jgi:uncharacterized membrane-anchored protein YitT (DUF2179 family)